MKTAHRSLSRKIDKLILRQPTNSWKMRPYEKGPLLALRFQKLRPHHSTQKFGLHRTSPWRLDVWMHVKIGFTSIKKTGCWCTYPSEKNESQLGLLSPNIWKHKKWSKPPTRTTVCGTDNDDWSSVGGYLILKQIKCKRIGAGLILCSIFVYQPGILECLGEHLFFN